ncbi:3-deoxy-d-manno-octulosonic acid hydrolase subunit 2 [Helicobacter pylori]|uniref:3-deoxy-d-manno-octulosonic acid hydrolase subunit 2 n=1 Tax=Helicobacter pylori TaxID=210 RepID=UPI001924D15A|nr:3-deoxy-d-manno-octulosonic acid hydrolase subunit 2 [Helicobacter pylori]QQW89439.1 3-deoxy-d-manno-octulosonic acid hydrolase subunit 2 [Helicobacter pylori]
MEHSRNRLKHAAFFVGLFIVLFLIIMKRQTPPYAFMHNQTLSTKNPPYFTQLTIPKPDDALSVHASALINLPNDNLLSAYFSGTKEGARDVKISANLFDSKINRWSEAFIILTKEELSYYSHEYIKKLGNPLLFLHDDKILLFVVGVSMGGWATSKIYQLESALEPIHFKFVRKLSLSPFLNLSHLIRNKPLNTTDGGFMLPLYHELATQYPLLLKFDKHNNPRELLRPNALNHQLQPSLTPFKDCAVMAFRNHSLKDSLMLETCKTPTAWQKPMLTNLKNLNDALNLINLNKELYLIHNPSDSSLRRKELLLSKLENSNSFKTLKILDKANEVSYPSYSLNSHFIDIVYTYNRSHIKHIRFNMAYLKSLLK